MVLALPHLLEDAVDKKMIQLKLQVLNIKQAIKY